MKMDYCIVRFTYQILQSLLAVRRSSDATIRFVLTSLRRREIRDFSSHVNRRTERRTSSTLIRIVNQDRKRKDDTYEESSDGDKH